MSIQAEAAGGGGGGGAGAQFTEAQTKALAQYQALNAELVKQNALLSTTDPLLRARRGSLRTRLRANSRLRRKYLKVLAEQGVPAIARTAAETVRLKFAQADLLATGKLLSDIADPYEKLGVQLNEVNRLEGIGKLTAEAAGRARLFYSDQVLKADKDRIVSLYQENALLAGQIQLGLSSSGGGGATQVAAARRLQYSVATDWLSVGHGRFANRRRCVLSRSSSSPRSSSRRTSNEDWKATAADTH